MPLTNRTRLQPRDPPAKAEPWHYLPHRSVEYWLNVSHQTLVNWRHRQTGPEWRKERKSKRIHYQRAAIEHWLDGPDSPSAEERIRTRLHELDRATHGTVRLVVHDARARDQDTGWKAPGVEPLWQALRDEPAAGAWLDALDHEQLTQLGRSYDRQFARPPLKQPKTLLPKTETPALVGYG